MTNFELVITLLSLFIGFSVMVAIIQIIAFKICDMFIR